MANIEGDNVDASAVVFDWESDYAEWSDTMGTGGSEWSGVATGDTEITVTVTGDSIPETSESATITVAARSWPPYKTLSALR